MSLLLLKRVADDDVTFVMTPRPGARVGPMGHDVGSPAWKVRLDSGRVERPAANDACVMTYPTRVDDGIVWVGVPAGAGLTP